MRLRRRLGLPSDENWPRRKLDPGIPITPRFSFLSLGPRVDPRLYFVQQKLFLFEIMRRICCTIQVTEISELRHTASHEDTSPPSGRVPEPILDLGCGNCLCQTANSRRKYATGCLDHVVFRPKEPGVRCPTKGNNALPSMTSSAVKCLLGCNRTVRPCALKPDVGSAYKRSVVLLGF